MSGTQLVNEGQGRFRVCGDMNFNTVPGLWDQSEREFAGACGNDLLFDLSGVGYFDSAGLALLVAWKRRARARAQSFTLTRVPSKLIDLARANNLLTLLGLDSVSS